MKGIRATEVRLFVKAHGEDGMIKVLEQCLERCAALEQNMSEMAHIQYEMMKLTDKVVTGAGVLRDQVEKMQRGGIDDDDDLPMAT